MKYISRLVLTVLLSFSTLVGVEYKVDASKSFVNFKVTHLFFSTVDGHFTKFKGSYDYDPQTNLLKDLKGEVTLASVSTDDTKRDDYLKNEGFFNIEKYPTMKLEQVEQKENIMVANLTIKEVSKPIELELEILKDPSNDTHRGLALKGKINRKDFGLSFDTADISVGKEVTLDIVLEKVEP
ncbi:MAG: YceI family protein [Epsilonproteobacteria bacterium]|nr:YceI family protein [Campylobacterota bacterium]